MFKKKPIYVVGIVLFTLILIADLAVFFLIPTGDDGRNRPGGGITFNEDAPEGFAPGNFSPDNFHGQMPGGKPNSGDFTGEMPENFGGERPGNGEFNIEAFDGQMPDGFDGASIPGKDQMPGGGVLTTVRNVFWPILIVCLLGDVLCIVMLVRISGKNDDTPDNDEDHDAPPRADRVNTWLAVIAVLLVAALIFSSLSTGDTGSGMEAQVSIQQVEAGLHDIASVFSGSGTLMSSAAEELEIPVSVTVASFAVKNGDVVQAGDVLANVDKTSVLKSIYDVQSLINQMDTEIARVQSKTLEDKITARANGRVKAIYVAEGDSVAGAMYENGAVMLISLGGSMTVVIESQQEVAVGQVLTVTLSDGSQIEGKVQQARDGKITVTTTDDGPTPDDTVTVATADGIVLGTGTLRISSPLKVTGFFGTVDKIKVAVGDAVKKGKTLLTLKDTEELARYQKLLRERQELTELVSELTIMVQDGTIKASAAGVVSQISEDAVYTPLSQGTSGNVHLSNLSASTTEGYTVVFLSNTTGNTPAGDAPPEGETPPPDGDVIPPVQENVDGTFAGKVTKVGYGSLQIKICETDMTGSSIAAVEAMDEALFTADRQYAPDLTIPVNLYQDGQTMPGSVNAIQAGDKVLIRIENGTVAQIDFVAGMSAPSQGMMPGGNMQIPAGGGFGGAPAVEEDEEEVVYEVEKTAICAIIPAETMTIEISVDELDILTIVPGQTASITLDALPGQSFTGTVQKINPTGSNNGGSTKYTVTMEVPRTEKMMAGMNASVLIEVGRLDSVLTVPAAAIYEDGNRTYVYTDLDEKSGEPANPVDVTTGSTDGSNIEICSGLASGDVVYYSYADSISYRFVN